MWAMRLWDEGYKRISKEMQQQIIDDEGRLVRGGSGGLAESGQQGIDLRNLKRTIANLVAPMPVQVLTSDADHAPGSSSDVSETSNSLPPPASPSTTEREATDWEQQTGRLPALLTEWPATGGELSEGSAGPTDRQTLQLHVPDDPDQGDAAPVGSPPVHAHSQGAVYWSSPDLTALRQLSAGSFSEHKERLAEQVSEQPPPAPTTSHKQAEQLLQQSSAPATPTTTSGALLPVPGPGPLLTPDLPLNASPRKQHEQLFHEEDGAGSSERKSSPPGPAQPASPPASTGSELDLEAPKVSAVPQGQPPGPQATTAIMVSTTEAHDSEAPPTFSSTTVPPPVAPTAAFHHYPSHAHAHHHPSPQPHGHHYNQHGNPPPHQAPPPLPPHQQPPAHHHQQQQQQQPAAGWGAPLACVPLAPLAAPPPPSLDPACLAVCREINLTTDVTLGSLIGEGGFGKVYLSVYLGQQVAIKIQGDESGTASMFEEFKRELTTMSALSVHRNVLSLVGACTRPPRLAIVTEFCARGSMFGLLHNPECHLSWAQIIYMCLGAANGMAHLHRCNVLHRDLKSANLLVDNDYTVKVADFGLSRLQSKTITAMTGGLGTYQWMAPEVLGNQRYSEKADVYSFGIVMWECTAREIPYAGMQGMQAAMAVMNRGLRPEIPSHTPPRLADLMRSCWRPIPSQRPAMDEVVSALKSMYSDLRTGSPLT